MNGPTLPASDGVMLRPLREQDLGIMASLADNPKIWNNLLDVFPHPYGLADAHAFYDRLEVTLGPLRTFAITQDQRFAGVIGFDPLSDVHRMGANIGYWLGEPYWGRGIATAALKTLTAYAFANLPLERLQAEVFAWNLASARVLEKAGYALEGRTRRSIMKASRIGDGLLYARLRGDELLR
jgi:RimJ/RimL family protein N-acetyltransferase